MRAGDGDAALEAHQLGQHFGARHDRHALVVGGDQFGIFRLDGAGDDDHIGIADVFRGVAAMHHRAHLRETPGNDGVGLVGAGHLVTERDENFGDATHAGTADANEMYAREGACQVAATHQTTTHHARASCSAISATAFAASGNEAARAACASPSNCARSPAYDASRSRNASSSLPSWRIQVPPPASSRNSALRAWWSSTAPGKGMRMLPTPAAQSSAMVSAPARPITRSAQP